MAKIRQMTTIADIKAERPEYIWYAYHTCWWTHRESDLSRTRTGLPCDPRGSVLLYTYAHEFLRMAEVNAAHYGRHGLDAFIAAHHDNCYLSEDEPRPWSLRSWDEYNDLLDEASGE